MELSYGSDRFGLICGYRFAPGAAGTAIGLEQALAWLHTDPAAGAIGFVWLHFNLSDAAAEGWIRQNLGVVPEFFEALHDGVAIRVAELYGLKEGQSLRKLNTSLGAAQLMAELDGEVAEIMEQWLK